MADVSAYHYGIDLAARQSSAHTSDVVAGVRQLRACRAEPTIHARHALGQAPSDLFENVARPGRVLIIATGGMRAGACIGGPIAYSLQRSGCAALITDGLIRDAAEIRELGFPVFSAGVTPVNGSRRCRLVTNDVRASLVGQSNMVLPLAGAAAATDEVMTDSAARSARSCALSLLAMLSLAVGGTS